MGSAPRGSSIDIRMTFGKKSAEKLRTLLRSPLPPSQSSRVGKELAAMVSVLDQSSATVDQLKPLPGESSITGKNVFALSPLDESKILGEQSVMTIERQRCIYAFDICARGCSSRATGSGKFVIERRFVGITTGTTGIRIVDCTKYNKITTGYDEGEHTQTERNIKEGSITVI